MYAIKDKSRLEEIISGNRITYLEDIELPTYRLFTASSLRSIVANSDSTKNKLVNEIELLDHTYPQSVTLLTYLFTLKNMIRVILTVLGLFLFVNVIKNKRRKETNFDSNRHSDL